MSLEDFLQNMWTVLDDTIFVHRHLVVHVQLMTEEKKYRGNRGKEILSKQAIII